MISSDEYVDLAHDGKTLCPNCEFEFFLYGALESEGPSFVSQLLICGQCGASWTECYHLTGYTELRTDHAND